MQAHAQPIDPQIASDAGKPKPSLLQCHTCLATYPEAHFGLAKYSRGGRATICHGCRAQYLRLKRKEKHGSRSKIDDSCIRSVAIHNKLIMEAALSSSRLEFRAFSTQTGLEYKAFYGPSERIGLNSLSLFPKDGSAYMEVALSGIKDPIQTMLELLRLHSLRLEYDDMAVHDSKKIIYYMVSLK